MTADAGAEKLLKPDHSCGPWFGAVAMKQNDYITHNTSPNAGKDFFFFPEPSTMESGGKAAEEVAASHLISRWQLQTSSRGPGDERSDSLPVLPSVKGWAAPPPPNVRVGNSVKSIKRGCI